MTGRDYNGQDFLQPGAACPNWWAALDAGECKEVNDQPALILSKGWEACCTFCIEYNRRGLQPPCTHGSFGSNSRGIENLCYVKTGTPSALVPNRHHRDSFTAGQPCAVYTPPAFAGPKITWGTAFLLIYAFLVVVYVTGGIALRAASQRSVGVHVHPHYQQCEAILCHLPVPYRTFYTEAAAGLSLQAFVVDGCAFVRGASHKRGSGGGSRGNYFAPAEAGGGSGGSSKAAVATAARRATRGKAGPLHRYASVGDLAKLQDLLRSAERSRHPINGIDSGDKRRWSPFHVACGGGHTECVAALIAAGADTTLKCDSGLDGWELAQSLKRTQVLQLRRSDNDSSAASSRELMPPSATL